MIRKIIGKIVETILPPVNAEETGKPAAADAPPTKVKTVSLEELGGALCTTQGARPSSDWSLLHS